MTARFASVSSRLSSLRATVPQYHSVEQGGMTQVLDAFWIDQPGSVTSYEQEDDEGEASRRTHAMRLCGRDADSVEPGLMIAEDATLLADISGNDVWSTLRWTLAWVDVSVPAGRDNAGQMVVAQYAGPTVGADPDAVLTMQVAAATGTWAGATNLLVVGAAEGARRRVFVVRTLNRQGGSVLAAGGLAAALGGI